MKHPPPVDFLFRQPPQADSRPQAYADLRDKRVARSADDPPYVLVGDPVYAAAVLRGEAFRSSILGDGGVPIHCPHTGTRLRAQDTLLASDGATHARLKSVLVEALEDGNAGDAMSAFERHAADTMARLRPDGHCEFLAQFAFPLSNRATCSRLGLPPGEFGEFAEEVDILMAALVRPLPDRARFEHLMQRMVERLGRALDAPARASGPPGVLAFIGGACRAERVSRLEALSLAVSIIQGMSRTAATLAAGALRTGLSRPRGGAAAASLAREWVGDELLRSPPVHSLLRVAAEGAQVGGYGLPAGTPVVVCLRALSVAASPRLWAFGLGPHACPSGRLGQDMAECMVAVALEMLPGLAIDTRGGECDDEPHPILSGPSRLRLCWQGA